VAHSLDGLANLYSKQGKYVEAEPLYQRALAIREQALGPEHSLTQKGGKNYAALQHLMEHEKPKPTL
jgi:tetratricopeptide (TPR) repeat protein